ncbi:MAG: EcsC family protein [Hydrococcus sp. Prado102]|nr:EcsC family protein [Hydrococcus sp. Prado102]
MSQLNFLEISQSISVDAIATFLNSHLILEGITVVKTKLKDNCLQILLIANTVPPQEKCVEFITNKLLIKDNSLKKIAISGLQIGENFPEWYQELELDERVAIVQQTNSSAIAPSLWNSVTKKASVFGVSISSTMNKAGKSIIEKTSKVSETFTPASVNNTFTQVTNAVGSLAESVSNNPHLQNLTDNFQNWLIENIDKVDIVRAETYVKQLQQKYPDETASKIARRLITEKATYAGGTELASSILPDIAIAMFAVDLVATTLLQVEMIYQIACAYGMDLNEPARKEEILAIFGLSLGGSQILKAGLGFVRNVPVAGGVISASSNALAVYTLGYAACRFYEAKSNPLLIEANLEEIQAAINDADKISQATEL